MNKTSVFNHEDPRVIDYLRISVTDRCNLRCVYCMPPEGIETFSPDVILSFEEIIHLAKIFAGLGIKKIRLTGGEPLVRRDVPGLVRSLAGLKEIEEVSLTTNGILLPFFAERLKEAGLKRLNISLDTLKEERFPKIAGSNGLPQVLSGIEKAQGAGFSPLKLNTVVMKGINDDEIGDFVEFALARGLILRFIEFMPATPLWREDLFFPLEKVKEVCAAKFKLKETSLRGPGPAEYCRVEGGIVGFIKTDESNCRCCNRLRLTSTGELKVCLYENEGLNLRDLLRNGWGAGALRDVIRSRMGSKDRAGCKCWQAPKAYMCSLGG